MFKKVLSFGLSTERASLLRKKLAALFIFACMSVNGFMPSTLEVSKHSLVVIMAAVTQNAVVNVFKKCNDSLVAMSNKICANIQALVTKTHSQAAAAKNDSESKKDTAAADEKFVLKQAMVTNRKVTADPQNGMSSMFFYSGNIMTLDYEQWRVPDKTAAPLLLLFLMFIFGIRQRKGRAGNTTMFAEIYAYWKTRISA